MRRQWPFVGIGHSAELHRRFEVSCADSERVPRGQLIRTRVEGIRIVGRSTQGVIVFDTAEGERVVSVERISEEGDDNGG